MATKKTRIPKEQSENADAAGPCSRAGHERLDFTARC